MQLGLSLHQAVMTGFTKIRFGKYRYWEFILGGNAVISFNNSLPNRMLHSQTEPAEIEISQSQGIYSTWSCILDLWPFNFKINTGLPWKLSHICVKFESDLASRTWDIVVTRNLLNLVLWPWPLTSISIWVFLLCWVIHGCSLNQTEPPEFDMMWSQGI